MGQKVTIKELESHYANHTLTELLKTIDIEDLKSVYYEITCDDIVGIRANIYDAIYNEFEYRENEYENEEYENEGTITK